MWLMYPPDPCESVDCHDMSQDTGLSMSRPSAHNSIESTQDRDAPLPPGRHASDPRVQAFAFGDPVSSSLLITAWLGRLSVTGVDRPVPVHVGWFTLHARIGYVSVADTVHFTLQASAHVHGDAERSSMQSLCPHPSRCLTRPPRPPRTPDTCLMPQTCTLRPTDAPWPL